MYKIEEYWFFAQEGNSGWELVDVHNGYPFRWWAQWVVESYRWRGRGDPNWWRYRIVKY